MIFNLAESCVSATGRAEHNVKGRMKPSNGRLTFHSKRREGQGKKKTTPESLGWISFPMKRLHFHLKE